ncbi:MAG: EAL domain-containing protein [Chloroflexi bacterium]|nr:EAL domain-containing protein [Chloroflexota bacterium]
MGQAACVHAAMDSAARAPWHWRLLAACAISGLLPVAVMLIVLTDAPAGLAQETILGGLLLGVTLGAGGGVLVGRALSVVAPHSPALAGRAALEAELRSAIAQDELLLHFQPIVGLAGPGTFGVEVLVRWEHVEHGLIPPDRFIPLAEESGLIVPLGAWVLRRAVEQMALWQRDGVAPDRICVNISARQIQYGDLPSLVAALLAESGIDPASLELELTESVVAEHAESTLEALGQLRALGVHLAVDDFGTGYSSLAYLSRFPVSTLKIDRAFLVDIERDTVHQAIVSAVTTLAHRVGVRVVAEGIETAGQLAVARSLDCDEIQGYLIGRPCLGDVMTAWLAGRRRQRPAVVGGVT